MTDNILKQDEREYSPTELRVEFAVTARALRFYEARKLLSPRRRGLARIYSEQDRARLEFILRGKRYGFTLIEIKHMLDLYERDDGRSSYMQAVLPKMRSQLDDLRQQRDDLTDAIAGLTEACQSIAETLSQQPDAANERSTKVAKAY